MRNTLRIGGRRGSQPKAWAVALVAALFAWACSDPIAYEEGPLGARRIDRAFLLDNRGDGAVSYVVVEERTSHVIDLAPCEDWPFLWPGERRLLPFDQVTGYRPDSLAVFYWCLLDIEGRAFDSGQFMLPF
ncbi:MAG: hypothetical protein HKN73_15780 [Gemmatimonadetes bacterium]|nr:hypothetical protein [Gemmatimonadota bacterium]